MTQIEEKIIAALTLLRLDVQEMRKHDIELESMVATLIHELIPEKPAQVDREIKYPPGAITHKHG